MDRAVRAPVVGMELAPGQTAAQLRPPLSRLAAVAVSGWSDPSGASPPPGGERGRESELRCGAFRLLNGGGFHQRPEVLVDRPLLGVGGLRNVAQKHCRSDDVLASLGELREIIPLIHDVVLDLTGVTLGAANRAMRMGR